MFKVVNLFKNKGLVFISDEIIFKKLNAYLSFEEIKLDRFCLETNGVKESLLSDVNNFTLHGKTDYEGDFLSDLCLVRQEGFKYIRFSSGSFLFFNTLYNHSDFINLDVFNEKDIASAGFMAIITNRNNHVDMIEYNRSSSLSKMFGKEVEAHKGDGKHIETFLYNHHFLFDGVRMKKFCKA